MPRTRTTTTAPATTRRNRNATTSTTATATKQATATRDVILPDELSAREKNFLTLFVKMSFNDASRISGLQAWDIYGPHASQTFRAAYNAIKSARSAATVARIEDALSRAAERDADSGGPDTRAAALLLPALDARYKATAPQQAQQVQINVTL